MSAIHFDKVPMTAVADAATPESSAPWLWDGYLGAGHVTLLTSQWKAGKTTLVTGLLRALAAPGEFLGRAVRPGRALVVSEESRPLWAERLHTMPVGPHVELLARPFRGRPTVEGWNALIDDARESRLRGELDLLVVDPLASFLPGRCESDAATLLEALQPLHRLAAEGVAVALLHHPRKERSEPGSSARGSGALLGFVDVVLELHRYGRLKTDDRRRLIVGQSRRRATPERLAYEWDPATGGFTAIPDPQALQFEENWAQVQRILEGREAAATHKELLMDWPEESGRPAASVLYEWLNRAFAAGRVERNGSGTRGDPWRYGLPRPELDCSTFPPLPKLW
jgi:hypothetical protein